MARLLLFLLAAAAAEARLQMAWPTPNTAWLEGLPPAAYVQPTVSGEVASGTFGCVRSDGLQFHEGLDLFPLERDRQGEPLDPVFAALAGVVRHVNTRVGDSSYGRYIVLEHPDATPAVYTLYAHLRSVEPGLQPGDRVARGAKLGVLGRSAGGYAIPKDRAHLHFEIGLMLTRGFQRWYDAQKFGSPNRHGIYNGMNLMGFDPKDFFDEFRARRADDVIDYLRSRPVAVTVRVARPETPDFAERYPALVRGERPLAIAGWEIDLAWTGLPLALRPLSAGELSGLAPGAVQVVTANHDEVARSSCIRLVRARGRGWVVARDLEDVIEKLFSR